MSYQQIKLITTLWFSLVLFISIQAQNNYWQQEAKYKMEIDFDVNKHQFTGVQEIKYQNNSPDTLTRVFYHLYFNAFQPGSMMDTRSRTIEDPDRRVGDRISNLSESEIGFQRILSLKQNGTILQYEVVGTILEVDLVEAILPGKTVKFEMEFEAQVPVQIRRSGRDNAEGISYSMTQWYPKLCEYDELGWHSNPYVGREFHGVWSDFDVKIKIDKDYVIGGTGQLKNANKIGYGYQEDLTKDKKPGGLFKKKAEWHFTAENVHDFAWAADPNYTHIKRTTKAGTVLHYFFQDNEETAENWRNLHDVMDEAEQFLNKHYGVYPYESYAFIQGGDGGMEYAMCTLITGHRNFESLVGVSIHEWVHSWYQMILGINESLYPWMDEGFTSYASAECTNYLRAKGLLKGDVVFNPLANSIRSYVRFSQSGLEEPLSTHADHYNTNAAYGVGSYTKGSVFLKQLEYIIGEQAFDKGMLRFYNEWKFKHPDANDFIRVMEKTSGMELDWYKEYFIYTTKHIDYAIDSVYSDEQQTIIMLSKQDQMPMPIDLFIEYKDGSNEIISIPLRIMRAEKADEKIANQYSVAEDWPWTHPKYELMIERDYDLIETILIDHTSRMADQDLENNIWPRMEK